MIAKFALWAAIPALLTYHGCDMGDFAGARYTKDFHYSYPLQPGGKLAIETFNGAVDLSAWDQNTVDIVGSKWGPSPEAADALPVSVSNAPDSVDIRVVRATNSSGNRGARFSVRMPRQAILDRITTSNALIQAAGGAGPARFRTSNAAIRIRAFTGALDARTSNGPIELIDVAGEVTARTSNGRIRAENLKGPLEASTSNGGINASLAPAPGDRPFRIETSNGPVDLTIAPNFASDLRVISSNGSITLHFPSLLNARVIARTSNATIMTDFQVREQGEARRNSLDGTIGNGGPLLDLSTSNAPIRLLKM